MFPNFLYTAGTQIQKTFQSITQRLSLNSFGLSSSREEEKEKQQYDDDISQIRKDLSHLLDQDEEPSQIVTQSLNMKVKSLRKSATQSLRKSWISQAPTPKP